MDQLKTLWQYQQEDMKVDRLAAEISKSPVRQTLEKDRAFIMDQKARYKKLEEKNGAMADRVDMLRDALPRCEEQLEKLQKSIKQNPPADPDAVKAVMTEAMRCRETISGYEKELDSIVKEIALNVQNMNKYLKAAAQAKQEYDRLKGPYDEELKKQKEQLDNQRKAAGVLEAQIDPEVLEHYKRVKKRVSPPLCHLNDSQCGGCCTSLAAAQLSKIKSGVRIECETCGRIILQ